MKNSEIAQLTKEELIAKIASDTESLQKLQFAHAISPIENPNKIKESRRSIARLKTRLRSLELAK
ncbi:50S ribosomal protein L29 [Aureibacter tunicatorum]|uniref:Large ribosomal subunit protein uL29 n=1 Tax=Aureibacter tunicatorum TaxID=866807 RepID=A0AAE4BPG7_9BACT|nr:50S ribosomal protein L29 [Aureibacter tunicatorum]MDR6237969.1 large subunit ribosomal protein L29 [Aureibacter tunicatorum]BDD03002.1 50S ribosomal protein L29 [Aureibacter tunicatorum]